MFKQPKWTQPTRQAYLVKLFIQSRGFCVFGHTQCQIPEHHYSLYIEDLIADWIAGDRQDRQADWQAELKAIHQTNDRRYPLHGQFNAISQDVFFDNQPVFYLDTLGMSGLTFKPFARLKLASNPILLHVDLGDMLKPLGKSKRRKAIRYGKIPKGIQDQIYNMCWLAVKDYLKY